MSAPPLTALADYRRRLKSRGIVRLELQVTATDAALLKKLVKALSNPDSGDATRAWLRSRLADGQAVRLKALLAAAPLDGIDLERPADLPRDIDL